MRDATAARREPAWDVARGVAVVTMVWVHFVPEPAHVEGGVDSIVRASVRGLDGLPAALFLLLTGAGVHLARLGLGASLRRAAALAAIGVPFWWFAWPNDILVPIALTTPAVAWLDRMGARALAAAMVVLCALLPVAMLLGGDYVWYVDWLEDGTHLANHSFGWHTLRWYTFDGSYPLLPFAVFPLVGALLARCRHDTRLLDRWLVAAVALVAVARIVDACWGDAEGTGAAPHLAITWLPATLPFVMLWAGAALLVAVVLLRWPPARADGRLAAVGRASLTHYVLHTAGLYAALRVWWPQEGWSVAVGIAAACGYLLFALAVTPWLVRDGRRAPLEALLAVVSRARRNAAPTPGPRTNPRA